MATFLRKRHSNSGRDFFAPPPTFDEVKLATSARVVAILYPQQPPLFYSHFSRDSVDKIKRDRLVRELAQQDEPQIVPICVFFDGNDDEGSIGCNLIEHPGIDVFRAAFARLSQREDVHGVYARIAELDAGEDSWPFSDTIFVVGTLTEATLALALSELEPDALGPAGQFGLPESFHAQHGMPVLAAWWD